MTSVVVVTVEWLSNAVWHWQVVHTYAGSGSFGELALMYNMPRAASVRAQSPGALWAMDRHTFRRILLKSAFKKRKLYEELLDKVPMLKALQVNKHLHPPYSIHHLVHLPT